MTKDIDYVHCDMILLWSSRAPPSAQHNENNFLLTKERNLLLLYNMYYVDILILDLCTRDTWHFLRKTHRIKLILTLHVGFDKQNIVDCFLYHKWQRSPLPRLLRARYQLLETIEYGVEVHLQLAIQLITAALKMRWSLTLICEDYSFVTSFNFARGILRGYYLMPQQQTYC